MVVSCTGGPLPLIGGFHDLHDDERRHRSRPLGRPQTLWGGAGVRVGRRGGAGLVLIPGRMRLGERGIFRRIWMPCTPGLPHTLNRTTRPPQNRRQRGRGPGGGRVGRTPVGASSIGGERVDAPRVGGSGQRDPVGIGGGTTKGGGRSMERENEQCRHHLAKQQT